MQSPATGLALHSPIAVAMPPTPTRSPPRAISATAGQVDAERQANRRDADPRTIVLVGGSVRAAAVDASESGYEIVAMDHFGDADLLAVCNRWIHLPRTDAWPDLLPDRNATIVPTGGFDWPPTETLAHPGIIAFPNKRQFDAMRNPRVLAELARDCEVGFPITIEPSDPASFIDLRSSASLGVDPQNWLIKPYAGTGGLGIRTPTKSGSCSILGQLSADEYLQQRIVGRSIGVNFISRFRDGQCQTQLLGIFAGLTHRQNVDHRWLYGGSIGPWIGDRWQGDVKPLQSSIANFNTLGDRIANRFELVGLFNVDFLLTPDQSLVLLEINPRYSASMELMPAAGCLIDCHVAAYQERAGELDRQQADKRFSMLDRSGENASAHIACKRIVYATEPMRFNRSVSQLYDVVRDLAEPLSCEVTFHDLPTHDDTIPNGYPVLSVIARRPVSHPLMYPLRHPSVNTGEPTIVLKTLVRQTRRIAARLRQSLV